MMSHLPPLSDRNSDTVTVHHTAPVLRSQFQPVCGRNCDTWGAGM